MKIFNTNKNHNTTAQNQKKTSKSVTKKVTVGLATVLLAVSLSGQAGCMGSDTTLKEVALKLTEDKSIPAGTVLTEETTFPAGVNFTGGYLLPDGTVVTAVTVSDSLTLPAGTILLGTVTLPNGTTFDKDFNLPAGTVAIASATAFSPGAVIPAGTPLVLSAALTGGGTTDITLPGETMLAGSKEKTAVDLTFPAGTIFSAGYIKADGSFVPADGAYPLTTSADVTLKAGSRFLGSAILPNGSQMVLPDNTTLNRAVVIPSCILQDAGAITLPVNTYIFMGLADDTGAKLADGNVSLTATVDMQTNFKYAIDVEVKSPLASADSGTATITWTTTVASGEEVRYSTTDQADADWVCSNVDVECVINDVSTTDHSVEITGLDADTQYYFRIYAGGASCSGATGGAQTTTKGFTTSSACSGGFKLVSVVDELSASTGNFGNATRVGAFADFNGQLYIGAQNGKAFLYKTDTSYSEVTTSTFEPPNNSAVEVRSMAAATLDTDAGNSQSVLLISQYADAGGQGFFLDFTNGEIVNDILSVTPIIDGSGGSKPNVAGFGNKDNHAILSMFVGNGFAYLGTQDVNNTATTPNLYIGQSLLSSANSASCGGPLIACNFSDDGGAGDVLRTQIGSDIGDEVRDIAEFNGELYVAVIDTTANTSRLYTTTDYVGGSLSGSGDVTAPTWTDEINAGATLAISGEIWDLYTDRAGNTLYISTENSGGAVVYTLNTSKSLSTLVDFSDGTGIGGSADTSNEAVRFILENGTTDGYVYFGTTKASGDFEIWRSGTSAALPFSQVGTEAGGTCNGSGSDGFGSSQTGFVRSRTAISVSSGNRLYFSAESDSLNSVRVFVKEDQ